MRYVICFLTVVCLCSITCWAALPDGEIGIPPVSSSAADAPAADVPVVPQEGEGTGDTPQEPVLPPEGEQPEKVGDFPLQAGEVVIQAETVVLQSGDPASDSPTVEQLLVIVIIFLGVVIMCLLLRR